MCAYMSTNTLTIRQHYASYIDKMSIDKKFLKHNIEYIRTKY